jgi:hypothetical protein
LWLTFEGRRVGFIFRSPVNRDWWQTCFVECFERMNQDVGHAHATGEWRFAGDSQAGIVRDSAPSVGSKYQLCNPTCAWSVQGGIEGATFESLTVTPSLDGSKGGLWHGFITNGEICGGI